MYESFIHAFEVDALDVLFFLQARRDLSIAI